MCVCLYVCVFVYICLYVCVFYIEQKLLVLGPYVIEWRVIVCVSLCTTTCSSPPRWLPSPTLLPGPPSSLTSPTAKWSEFRLLVGVSFKVEFRYSTWYMYLRWAFVPNSIAGRPFPLQHSLIQSNHPKLLSIWLQVLYLSEGSMGAAL